LGDEDSATARERHCGPNVGAMGCLRYLRLLALA
jgi:hypothetical protein